MAYTPNNGGINLGGNSTAFTLMGGEYGLLVSASSWSSGNVQLTTLGPDGSTFINVGSSFTANAYQDLKLPPGQYQWVITTSTGVNTAVIPVKLGNGF